MRAAANAVVFVLLLGVLGYVLRDHLPRLPRPYDAELEKSNQEYLRVMAVKEAKERALASESALTEQQARDFITKARAADAIKDPLQRCLAYPDLPGNHWPRGLAQAHCEYLFGAHVDRDWVRARIVAGDYATLERRFAADMDSHFASGSRSEAIHRDLYAFDGDEESDGLTRKWLEHSPGNAYALAARGEHYRWRAWDARGTKFVDKIPNRDLAAMDRHVSKGIEYLRGALKAEPRLMPAYEALLDLALMTGDDELKRETAQAGYAADPGCFAMATMLMRALQPRWGGSEDLMRRFAMELQPIQSTRPLLALSAVEPEMDLADRLKWAGDKGAAWVHYRAAARASTLQTPAEILSDYDYNASLSQWEGVIYAVQAGRYIERCTFCTLSRRGERLVNNQIELDWARESLEQALSLRPDDIGVTGYLGTVARLQKRWDDSNRYHDRALDLIERQLAGDPGYAWARMTTLMALADTAFEAQRWADARRLTAQIAREFPNDNTGKVFVGMAARRFPAAEPVTAH